MKLSDVGRSTLIREEGKRLVAYRDHIGKWTIGVGQTTIRGRPVQEGDRLTEQEFAAELDARIAEFEVAINAYVKVPLNQVQFDALFIWAWNVGIAAMRDSTLVQKLNDGDYAGAADQFLVWNKVTIDGVKRSDPLILERRKRERSLFLSKHPVAGHSAAPIVESRPTWEAPVTPFVAAALPALVQAIPELIRSFGKGEVSERNARAAETVMQVVQAATNTQNAQAAVEAVQNDPVAREAARAALQADHWFDVTEAGGGGIEGARAFSKNAIAKGDEFWRMGVFWVTLALLPLLYGTVYLVLTGSTEQFSGELRAAIASSVVTGVLGGVIGFWLGLKFSAPKADAIALGR